MTEAAITAFATLFVVIDPIGLAPMFIVLTRGMDARQRRRIGLRAVLVAAGILTGFALVGEALLSFVGITLPAFRIAGGLLLFMTAFDMLFERRTERRERQTSEDPLDPDRDPSVFPLAIPMVAGPGAITSVILLMAEHEGDLVGQSVVMAVLAGTLALVWIAFEVSGPVGRALGRTGVIVVTRLFGMILAALSVQFVIDGLRGAGLTPG